MINETHNPELVSWVESANMRDTDFPIQNLPFGAYRTKGENSSGRVGVAIGNQILDVAGCLREGLFTGTALRAAESCNGSSLNPFMALGSEYWSALRKRLSEILRAGSPDFTAAEGHLSPMAAAEMLLPAAIGDYTDFYASIHHATNVGSMFRPDNPLLPNYKHVPIGYHGRSSSIVVSGTGVRRPQGQTKDDSAPAPEFGPSKQLDYELEVGFFVGAGNKLGESIDIEKAEERIFGLCLVNDWSARDIQKWEYQPLGPFLAKNFGTSISPWVVSLEALVPFRTQAFQRPAGDPQPLPYLTSQSNQKNGGIDLTLEVHLLSQQMRNQKTASKHLTTGTFADMYWTIAQMLTHHASNGCNLRAGDLLASGTVSGREKASRGCLLELTQRGTEPIDLPSGEQRRFLEDGDEVIMRGYCRNDEFRRVGFGECRGIVVPSI
ncbi:MAG: fumarylacetoacetase [Bacteroidota bacterium]